MLGLQILIRLVQYLIITTNKKGQFCYSGTNIDSDRWTAVFIVCLPKEVLQDGDTRPLS